jgi:hypothetical protein
MGWITSGPWKTLGGVHRREIIRRANDEELYLRYQKKIADDKKEVERDLIELEKKALEQVQ